MRLLILADTHVPKRARDLPADVWAALDAADVVIHAGDWVDIDLLDRMQARSRRLVGVVGNNDGPALFQWIGNGALLTSLSHSPSDASSNGVLTITATLDADKWTLAGPSGSDPLM